MADKFLLSVTEGERDILRALLRAFRGRNPGEGIPSSPQNPEGLENDHQAPEVYVARVPTGGLPGLQLGANAGTGTGILETGDDIPGKVDCLIYRIVDPLTADPSLELITDLKKTVYNLSEADIPAGAWITVIRDKFGLWIASTSGGAGGDEIALEIVTNVCLIDDTTGTGTAT